MNAKTPIPLRILEEITNGFSVDSRIGRGGYADVYKGVYNKREIAVKLLLISSRRGEKSGTLRIDLILPSLHGSSIYKEV